MRTILKSGRRMAPAVLLLMVLIGSLPACSSGAGAGSSASGRMRVVAAENFWGSIAKQIAGKWADVTSVINNPDTDPHDYEPAPGDARTVAGARVVIENAIGYDPWMQQLLAADPSSGRVVLSVGAVLHAPDGSNPHQWYSQAAVEQVIAKITADLGIADPKHRAAYEHNEHTLESTGLAEYDALIAQIRQRYSGTAIGASESIVSPWAATLGLKLITPEKFLEAVAEGNEPTASDKATADAQISSHQIAVFVFNSQNSTPDVQRLVDAARGAGIPVTTVTETLTPATATFQEWQVRQLRDLLAALARGTGR
jgi:zinc/manganese transport system substrate-binding protein